MILKISVRIDHTSQLETYQEMEGIGDDIAAKGNFGLVWMFSPWGSNCRWL